MLLDIRRTLMGRTYPSLPRLYGELRGEVKLGAADLAAAAVTPGAVA